jgi:dienelactone hydrolase
MRWLRRLGIGLLVVLVLLVACEPSRVAMQTLVLLPSLLGAGPQPLQLFSAAPLRRSVPYRSGEGADDLAELWLPAGASADQRAGAILLVFGVNSVGRNHPEVVRLADALARSGVAVLVPDSRTLLEGRLEVGEIDGVVQAFELLAARHEVDPARVSIAGFSVGGSLALLAARDARIADRVQWVNAFGAYADAATYLASVAAHAYELDGEVVAWEPTQLAREVYLRFVLDQVADAADASALRSRYERPIMEGSAAEPSSRLEDSLQTDAGRAAYRLLTAASLADAERAIRGLPAKSRALIDALSPVRHLDGLLASVLLMHESQDHHVPFVQSRVLRDAIAARRADGPPGGDVSLTEFRLFDHVQPDDVDLVAAAPELWKLWWHLQGLMLDTL